MPTASHVPTVTKVQARTFVQAHWCARTWLTEGARPCDIPPGDEGGLFRVPAIYIGVDATVLPLRDSPGVGGFKASPSRRQGARKRYPGS